MAFNRIRALSSDGRKVRQKEKRKKKAGDEKDKVRQKTN